MSLIVAIKDKDRIIFGADKQSSTGLTKSHDTIKIWEIEELPGAIMGGVGSCRCSQIIQYAQILDKNDVDPEKFDTSYVINSVVPNIVGILKANGINCTVKENDEILMIPNTFLLAYEDKAWMIWNDLSVTELQDYLAIGSGSDVAMGALYATKKQNPFERIVTCIDAAAESTLFVDNGVDLLATVCYEEDIPLINKAFGYEMIPEPKKEKNKETKKVDKKKDNKKKSTDKKGNKKERQILLEETKK